MPSQLETAYIDLISSCPQTKTQTKVQTQCTFAYTYTPSHRDIQTHTERKRLFYLTSSMTNVALNTAISPVFARTVTCHYFVSLDLPIYSPILGDPPLTCPRRLSIGRICHNTAGDNYWLEIYQQLTQHPPDGTG